MATHLRARWLAALVPLVPMQELRPGEPLLFELRADDALLTGRGQTRAFPWTADFSGKIFVWVSSDVVDPFLRIEGAAGSPVLEDDDKGGGTTAFVELVVEPGARFTIEVASARPGELGEVELHLGIARETAETRAAGEWGGARLAGIVERIQAMREPGEFEEARAGVESLVDELLALDGARESPGIREVLWGIGIQANALEANQAGERALAAVLDEFERLLPPEHFALQVARGNLALFRKAQGNLSGARQLEEQAIEVLSRTRPEDDPELQLVRANLARTLFDLGDLSRTRELEAQVLAIRLRTLSPEHMDVQKARCNLGVTLHMLGDLQGARVLHEQALAVLERTLSEDDLYLQEVRLMLSNVLHDLGDYAACRELDEKALEVYARTLPEDNSRLVAARWNLAITLTSLGEYELAHSMMERLLEAMLRSGSADDPHVQSARLNLGVILCNQGKFQEAREHFEQVLEARARSLPEDDLGLQKARQDMAMASQGLGDLARAEELLEQVLDVRSRLLPEDNPDLLVACSNLVICRAARGNGAGAREIAVSFARGLRHALREAALSASPREAEERASAWAENISSLLSLGSVETEASFERECFELVESLRCVGLLGAHLYVAAGSDPEIDRLRREAQHATEELAGLLEEGAGLADLAAQRQARDAALGAISKRLSAAGEGKELLAELSLEALRAKLAADEALIGFWRYRQSEFEDPLQPRGEEHLLAYIVTREAGLARVELGSIEALESATERWRAALGVSDEVRGERGIGGGVADVEGAGERETARALAALVFDPLEPRLGGMHRLIVAPDDVVHLIPFDALPCSDGRLIGERFEVELRSTLWERLLHARPPTKDGAIVLVGGVDYDTRADLRGGLPLEGLPAARGSAAMSGAPVSLVRSGSRASGFAPLPASALEVRSIASLVPEPEAAELCLLTGPQATREVLESMAPSARYLHLATHGWFTSESATSANDSKPLDERLGFLTRVSLGEQVRRNSPLVLCGLALAGANLPADLYGRVGAALTAEELAALDLRHCELAVLSACDTNVGIRRAGQGVASLQKALHMAGARSVITSLWRVPDEATKELMMGFYRRLWTEGRPKDRALWEAKMELRTAQDSLGNALHSTRDWAGWVLTGSPD